MESKRFPRVSSLKAASPDDPGVKRFTGVDNKADSQRARAAGAGPSPSPVDLGGNESPAWQDYFFLAPNVRFTRTPDYEASTRRPRDEAIAVKQSESPAPQAPGQSTAAGTSSSAPIPSRNLSSGAARPPVGNRAVVQPAPAPVPSGHAGEKARAAATPAGHRMTAAARASAPAASAQAATAPVKTTARENVRWPYLSDHVFFEVMAPYLVEGPSPAPRAVSVARTTAPVVTERIDNRPAPTADPTALFRVIECLPGSPAPSAVPDVRPANSNQAAVQPAANRVPQQARAPAAIPAVASNAVPALVTQSLEQAVPAPAARASSRAPLVGRIVPTATGETYELPSEELLQQPPEGQGFYMSQERLEQNADLLESVLEDFGVRGEIIHVRPGPVVTLYEFEPAPGVKSSRVIGLADDIARSMSAISARVAVVPGRNVIGIELPNEARETVYFRELIESEGFRKTGCKLALCLGKTIGGEPVIAELAKMPHLLVAGTTGSGKSVAINTMILSLLYRLKPEECRLIMVDPKMLELSVYDGIPHLLTPVVTDPKKAVTALKWAVREMEDRYRKMARLGVRNIDGYNQRAAQARESGETVVMTVQAGFEKGTGEPLFEQQEIDLAPMPYIVVIVDEMADLMMVAGKEIEGAIQRLAQMARAAGIHLIMATQRPSVDVITGTIKANFPTRISFQVTSKIDSRTILGEQGAEQLLGQGDMLHMMGGGRIARVHGPFVSDVEVEHVVAHLKAQGRPEYLETVTADEDEEEDEGDEGAVFDKGAVASEDGDTSYDEAVKVVLRDKKCSTSYIQRRLGIGYNRAASLVERMEKEGLVGAPNHVGKREIIMGRRPPVTAVEDDGTD
ncbi:MULTISPECIES: DNA translocase FtsK [unclassified Mesorhizobium]|uniref:DNA translocase FtsK n=1 Tax=unclassified Mesorhizobium TaxID=325217 RepID=UPI00112936BF|nr:MULTISPECIES: DNA translocase FtsK [unclassified Mesorhizobium]TPK00994.1 DNA translocase FtsK [Mesorhizobium sp. B2-5-12]TPK26124.1 DNA translocase FtsK [Mesorhizobium sp. B2-5-6]